MVNLHIVLQILIVNHSDQYTQTLITYHILS